MKQLNVPQAAGILHERGRLVGVGAAVAALVALAAVAGCGDGGVRDDRTHGFGSGGVVRTDFGGIDGASAVAVQGDGKIVAVGRKGNAFALARYMPSGRLDPSFGSDGRVVTEFGGRRQTRYDQWKYGANSVVIQRDGKIVVAGGTGGRFGLTRYTVGGDLDRSFGRAGKVLTGFGGLDAVAESLAVQPDGKIVAAGRSGFEFALARYLRDGRLDSSFDVDGKVLTRAGGGDYDVAEAVALQPDGKIVVAGWSGPRFANVLITRYAPNGQLDMSFGKAGVIEGPSGEARAVAIQRDGKIVTVGTSFPEMPDQSLFELERFTVAGNADSTFGRHGIASISIGRNRAAGATAVAVQPDGKIVAAGLTVNGAYALVRCTPDGRPDESFGRHGKVLLDLGPSRSLLPEPPSRPAIAIQHDGKIIVAGAKTSSAHGWDFMLARYTTVGDLDT